jgi:hypothetical protein
MSTQIYYRDPAGNLQTIIQNFVSLEYARAENKIGYLNLALDPAQFDTRLLRENARLEPWRSVGGNSAYLDGESVFFLRNWGYEINSDGSEIIRLECFDGNYLLDAPIVAYAAGSAQAERTNEIDDMMKSIIRDNLGADATDTARNLGVSVLTVQADTSLAPSTTKSFSRRNVLSVLQELATESLQQGVYLSFDVVYTGSTTLEFRTFTGQRGTNHGKASASPVVISRERKNFEEPKLWERHADERNYIYAGGQGEKAARVIKTASTVDALGINRREFWVDARQADVDAAVQADANAALGLYRAKKTLTGKIIDTDGCRDGLHYQYGDKVYAEYRGQGYDAHLDMMHVTIQAGQETRYNQIRAEE